jgi:RimJ/RimL family protein N-acetyltransferase
MVIIGEGGAVNLNTMKRDLPRSHVLAVASYRGEIVAVGAIKPVRKEYAAGIAVKCKYSFPAETPELGYVSVDAAHRGRGLSHETTRLLLAQYQGRLFATTDSPRMKKALADAGFRQEGEEWEGARGRLSFWERNVSSKNSES